MGAGDGEGVDVGTDVEVGVGVGDGVGVGVAVAEVDENGAGVLLDGLGLGVDPPPLHAETIAMSESETSARFNKSVYLSVVQQKRMRLGGASVAEPHRSLSCREPGRRTAIHNRRSGRYPAYGNVIEERVRTVEIARRRFERSEEQGHRLAGHEVERRGR